MTTQQILKKSFSITTSHAGLWALGIFLSSGFNLHWWYLLSWLKQVGIVNKFIDYSTIYDLVIFEKPIIMIGLVIAFVLGLIVFNLVKLWFFGKIHVSLHSENKPKCFLCKRLFVDKHKLASLIIRTTIIRRTCLASLITIGSTVLVLSLYRVLINMASFSVGKATILTFCLVIILIGISLWNMLVVLFVFWYEQAFTKASILALDILFGRAPKILGFTIILTAIFLMAISLGSLIIWQLPELFSTLPNIIANNNIVIASQTIISWVAGLMFLGWLVINNVFFNVAMLVMFDQLIGALVSKESHELSESIRTKPVMLHH